MSRVYILGAGASKFAGYPLARELWPFIRSKSTSSGHVIAEQRRTEVISQVERLLEFNPPSEYDRPNLEELFTYLDLTELIPNGLLELRHIQWTELRSKLVGVISDSFRTWEYDLQTKIISGRESQIVSPSDGSSPVDGAKVREVLDAWSQRIHAGDIIISFNWDILHEAALWRVNKWNYTDGYGFRPTNLSPGMCSPVEVLKLHGSANWVQEWETDEDVVIEEIATFFADPRAEESTVLSAAAQWDEGRKSLVTPTYLKNITGNRLLLSIWSQAARYLRNTEEVVVIGYSLNKADLPARYLIATSIRENPQCDMVELVMHDSGEWSDFCFNVGIGMRRVKGTFEEWVLGSAA